jgi:hypothetical protein
MVQYLASVGDLEWGGVRALAKHVNHDDALVARWLLHDSDASWVEYASAKTLALLFKLFSHVLRTMSTSVILSLSAVDLLAEILMRGLHRMQQLGEKVLELLRFAATWAGIQVTAAAEFTAAMIRRILSKMLSSLRTLSTDALNVASRNILPMSVAFAGAYVLTSSSAF